jgi:hypothetical protein
MSIASVAEGGLATVGLQIAKQSQLTQAQVVTSALETATEIADSAPAGNGAAEGRGTQLDISV